MMAFSRYAQVADIPNEVCELHGLLLARCVTCVKMASECDFGPCLAAPTHTLTQWRDGRALERRPMCEHHAETYPTDPGITLTVDTSNVRYDDTVHAVNDDGKPLCGTATMPAVAPERTVDPVDCWECAAIV